MRTKLTFLLLPSILVLNAQEEKTKLRDGNAAYKHGNYNAAASSYKEALEKKKNYSKANYNLGNALYKSNSYEDAKGQYEVMLNSTSNKDTLATVYHNMGNSFVKMKKYEDAVKAYKNSLKMNPTDEETRYNLAWAQKKLQQQGKGGGDGENKQNGSENNKENENKKIDNKKQEQKEQEQQASMSKEEAKRMLEALKNHERKLLEDKKEKNKDTRKSDVEKDW